MKSTLHIPLVYQFGKPHPNDKPYFIEKWGTKGTTTVYHLWEGTDLSMGRYYIHNKLSECYKVHAEYVRNYPSFFYLSKQNYS